MELWEKILQMALLGSERSHLEPAVADVLRYYKVDPEDPLPQVILAAAATLHQLSKIQIPTKTLDRSLPDPSPEEEQHLNLPSDSLLHLKQILSGRYQRALPEFVQLLLDKQWLLPAEFLPELLDSCLQDRELWLAIQPLLGNRARWLISQRPEWNVLIPQADPAGWPTAGPEARKQILAALRNQDPHQGIVLLASSWMDFDARQKLALLDLLETGLTSRDEAFLEECLDDGRKEVRLKAADLLARIPESQLVNRLFQLVISRFSYTPSNRRLEVNLPEEIPEAGLRDGIHPAAAKGKDGGLKVNWLAACIKKIPTRYWLEHFNWHPEELIRIFGASNRADLLLTALGEASIRFKEVEISVHLIRHLVLKNGSTPHGMHWQALAKQVPASAFQEISEVFFQQQTGLLEEQHLLTKILELGIHPWSELMTRRIIQDLKQWMTESKTFFWNLWHYKRLLEIAGYCSPIALFAELDADWPVHSPVWNQWAPDVERMVRILRFRMEMVSPPQPSGINIDR